MYYEGDEDVQKFLRGYGIDTFDLRSKPTNLNCTPPDVLDFPNVMRKRSYLTAALCFLMSIYLFVTLAIVCDDYLVPAMECLCHRLRLTYDVAGATFLAAATSAPELFVNLIGTFITEGDIGVGTIVGSSVFNVLVIAAVCGVATGVSTKLDWWPITRDCFWYLLAIILLFVVLVDSEVRIYEAGVLIGCYFIYLFTLIFDSKVQGLCRTVDTEAERINENPLDREEEPILSFKDHVCGHPTKEDSCLEKVLWVIKYPSMLILAITTPSVRFFYPGTMFMAAIWISIVSYLEAWFLTVVGYNIGIPDSIMGLTVLAAGTSVPEIVSSYIVTKKGYGSMAMCNAIGSNTFDIFVCLGLPWLIKNIIFRHPVIINSSGLSVMAGLLAFSVLMLYFAFLVSRFVLGKGVGSISIVTYVLFLTFSIFVEIYMLKPICDIESPDYEFLNRR